MRRAVGWLPRDGFAGKALAWAANHNARRMAHRFIAGSTVAEGRCGPSPPCGRRSLTFTIDLLGEATITEVEAEQYQQQYFELIEGLSREVNTWPAMPLIDSDVAGPIPRVNVSVKLSSLYHNSTRLHRTRRVMRFAPDCGRSCGWLDDLEHSSISTWSSTASRT